VNSRLLSIDGRVSVAVESLTHSVHVGRYSPLQSTTLSVSETAQAWQTDRRTDVYEQPQPGPACPGVYGRRALDSMYQVDVLQCHDDCVIIVPVTL